MKKYTLMILFVIGLCFTNTKTKAEVNINYKYDRLLGNSEDSYVYDSLLLEDNSIIVVGVIEANLDDKEEYLFPSNKMEGANSGFIARYDKKGTLVWKNIFNANSYATFTSLTLDNNNDIIVAGYSNGEGGNIEGSKQGITDGLVVKYDIEGNHIWNKNIGGNGSENFLDVVVNKDNEIIIVGNSNSKVKGSLNSIAHNGRYDGLILKLDEQANVLWSYHYGSDNSNNRVIAEGVDLLSDDSIVVVVRGLSIYEGGSVSEVVKGNKDQLGILKFDQQGNKIKSRLLSDDTYLVAGKNIEVIDDNNIIISGYANIPTGTGDFLNVSTNNMDGIIINLDSDFNIKWITTDGLNGTSSIGEVVQQQDKAKYFFGGYYDKDGSQTGYIAQINLDGTKSDIISLGGNSFDNINTLKVGKDDSFVVGGYTMSSESGDIKSTNFLNQYNSYNNTAFILKYSSNQLPVISASPIITIKLGTKILNKPIPVKQDYIDAFIAAASDYEDGILTALINVDFTNINYSATGIYNIIFSVNDSDGNPVSVTVQLKIIPADDPIVPDKPILPEKPVEPNKPGTNNNLVIQTGLNIVTPLLLIILSSTLLWRQYYKLKK